MRLMPMAKLMIGNSLFANEIKSFQVSNLRVYDFFQSSNWMVFARNGRKSNVRANDTRAFRWHKSWWTNFIEWIECTNCKPNTEWTLLKKKPSAKRKSKIENANEWKTTHSNLSILAALLVFWFKPFEFWLDFLYKFWFAQICPLHMKNTYYICEFEEYKIL